MTETHVRARFEGVRKMKTRSMSFADAMIYGMNRRAQDGAKVLDWDKAAEICAATKDIVWAGLAEDWTYTSGLIWDGEKQVRDYVFVVSDWATPVLVVGDYDGDAIECFKAADDGSSSEYPEWWGDEEAAHD